MTAAEPPEDTDAGPRRSRYRRRGLALVLLLLAAAAGAAGFRWSEHGAAPPVPSRLCTLYASPDGRSGRKRGTIQRPLSVQGLVNRLRAGQTGCLLAGTYSGRIIISRGGTPGRPIRLRSTPRYHATIDGQIWVRHSAHDVVVSNLTVDNVVPIDRSLVPPVSDLLIEGDRVTIEDSELESGNTGICVLVGGEDGVANDAAILRDSIHNCGPLPAYNHGHGIYVEHSQFLRIVGNLIYDNADRGIQLYPDAQHTLIAKNIIDGNGEGIIISGDSDNASSNNIITDNVISDSVIRYNVESFWGGAVGVGNVVRDNCLWNGAEGEVGEQLGFTAVDNTVADPRFADASTHDYRLLAGSGCAALGRLP
ncbi:MAG TPA: right-handed parallel beta-helix repeat-containing protein [Gaiellaceae bacterium]|nr:right-handed parallel beta-helix repeat-containing protein [Gaiellaceae bacterium]